MDWIQQMTMVDYIIIGAVLVAMAVGWAKGIVNMLTGIAVFLISLFVAGRYTPLVLAWLNRSWGVEQKLADALERRINLPSEAFSVPSSGIPWHKALDWLREVPLPETYKQGLAQRLEEWSVTAGTQSAANYIIQQVAAGILSAVVFVVMVAVLGWGLGLIGRLVGDQIKEIPLVGTANRLAGAAAASFETITVLAVLVALVIPSLTFYGFQSLGTAVGNAELTPHLLTFFDWIRALLFAPGRGSFFLI